jgi:ribosomal protein S18 acetylase RimI-like enzyme
MKKEIYLLRSNDSYDLLEMYAVFKDVIYNPSEDNINKILSDYATQKTKKLYGFFFEKKLIGIIGIDDIEPLEILHFGIHPDFRNQSYGTELMNYIKNAYSGRKIFLTTADDAVVFYKKYGFSSSEFFEDINGEKTKRYKCELA